jgi:hypothetical protein
MLDRCVFNECNIGGFVTFRFTLVVLISECLMNLALGKDLG